MGLFETIVCWIGNIYIEDLNQTEHEQNKK